MLERCPRLLFLMISILLWRGSFFLVADSFVLRRTKPTARAPTELSVMERFLENLRVPAIDAFIVAKALRGRRTVNNFETTKVPEDVVRRAVEAAIHAPCHKMTEPWRFIHLGDQTISNIAALNAAEIAKKDPVKGEKKKRRWEAIPGWCVVTAAKSDGGQQEREDYAATCCAVQNFMLSLWAEGVGTKWTTGPVTRTAEFAELCGIDPKVEDIVGCIWYGYCTGGLQSVTAPKRKRNVEDVSSRRP